MDKISSIIVNKTILGWLKVLAAKEHLIPQMSFVTINMAGCSLAKSFLDLIAGITVYSPFLIALQPKHVSFEVWRR